jgi:hypothetical protein
MTSMWERGLQRLRQRAAIVAVCPSFDRCKPVPHWHETLLNCADSPP